MTRYGGKYSDIYVQTVTLDFPDVLIVHDFDGNILTLMNMMHKALSEKENNYTNIADSLLDTICQYIKKLSNVSFQNPVVYKLKNTIYENIENAGFDLTFEIAQSGSNADYLRRCFKKEIGKTPLGYLTWLRINQAKTLLLQDTFISVEDVSAHCGFHDSFYFSTCFKKHTGIAPLQYRNRSRDTMPFC
ncbi:MAG: helix-turn-helix transcriptional regulator [Roseburia sp.]|nr:helix-turn-helix transcriptional regulator [Roseburia sp.]